MEKNQRNPRKRLNSLILLVAFTAVMLIVSTYAWFSAQKNVTISNLEGKVNVAEGLMVSLDAKTWTQQIDFEDYDTSSSGVATYTGTGAADSKPSLATIKDGSTDDLYILNHLPTEMIPVSTTGTSYTANTTTGAEEIDFFAGVNVEGHELYGLVKSDLDEEVATETDYPGYFAIDLFLQNSSKIAEGETQGTTKETLQLNVNSVLELVTGGVASTGLQNTVRAALAMYEPVDGASKTTDQSVESSVYVTANQTQILKAYNGAEIADVAIWEPNADQHVDAIVTNVNDANRVLLDATQAALYPITETIDTKVYVKLTPTVMMPTFALTADSLDAEEELTDDEKTGIKDIYNWSTTDGKTAGNGLTRQIALQTKKSTYDYSIINGGVRNLISNTSSGEAVYEYGDKTPTASGGKNETGAVEFQMYKNTIVKCRLYLWLEGQDVDCINYASHGSGVHLDLGLVKGQEVGSGAADS